MAIQDFTRPAAKIRAAQWAGDNLDEIVELAGEDLIGSASGFLTVEIRGEATVVPLGWWVYRESGRLAVCSGTAPQVEAWQPAA